MMRYIIVMDWETQNSKNVNSPQIYIQVEYNFYQNLNEFMDTDKIILKFVCEGKRTKIAMKILKNKSNLEEVDLSNFKTYDIAPVIKMMCIGRALDTHINGID